MSVTSAKSGATGISLALDNNYMEPIATTLVGSGGVNQITFNDIPQTYKHLQIRMIGRSSDAAGTVNVNINYNGDTSANYAWHRIYGNGTTAGANGSSSQTTSIIGQISGNTAGSNIFGVAILDILDYTTINKYKTTRALFGFDDNNGGAGAVVNFFSGLWMNTDSINSIKLTSGAGFAQYSRFSLYGIKG